MPNGTISKYLEALKLRRKELKMPLRVLAKRARIPRATLCRLLRGNAQASFRRVMALAEALGVGLELQPKDAKTFREEEADRQARLLVRLVQGNMALENQAVDKEQAELMVAQTRDRLMQLPPKKLWVE